MTIKTTEAKVEKRAGWGRRIALGLAALAAANIIHTFSYDRGVAAGELSCQVELSAVAQLLSASKDALSTARKEGADRAAELQARIDQANVTIKALQSKYGNELKARLAAQQAQFDRELTKLLNELTPIRSSSRG